MKTKSFLTRDAAINFFMSHRSVAINVVELSGKFVVVLK